MKTNMDRHGRYRSVTVAFRVSPEESAMIDRMVKISGMSKQKYILTRLENKDVIVIGNPRVYIGLKRVLQEVLEKLETAASKRVVPEPEILETIRIVANVLEEMKTER